ncbi:hypothetical protein F4679DRAFT_526214, partial [Xylaria curta]
NALRHVDFFFFGQAVMLLVQQMCPAKESHMGLETSHANHMRTPTMLTWQPPTMSSKTPFRSTRAFSLRVI